MFVSKQRLFFNTIHMKYIIRFMLVFLFNFVMGLEAQVPPSYDLRMDEIISAVSANRIYGDIERLANFGTRHTLSDTVSDTRGIGAARRWIKSEFEQISKGCNDCLDVSYHKGLVEVGTSPRIPNETWIVNVLALKKRIDISESIYYYGR